MSYPTNAAVAKQAATSKRALRSQRDARNQPRPFAARCLPPETWPPLNGGRGDKVPTLSPTRRKHERSLRKGYGERSAPPIPTSPT
jgi:hypothetical protein